MAAFFHTALLPNKGGALRDETITAAKETPMVVSIPGGGGGGYS